MKKLLTNSGLILLAVLFSNLTISDNTNSHSNVLGIWKYSVPEAPYEYKNGKLTIEKMGETLNGHATLNDKKITLEDIELEKNTLTFYIYIEDTKVSFKLDFERQTFFGNVCYAEEILSISGKKID